MWRHTMCRVRNRFFRKPRPVLRKKIALVPGENDNETGKNYGTDKNFNSPYSYGINEKMR